MSTQAFRLSFLTRRSRASSVERWLRNLPVNNGINYLSDERRYAHAEDDYDAQYGVTNIEKTIGCFVLNSIEPTPSTILEIACGTGHLTTSMLFDGRFDLLVASDASDRFLEITKRKAEILPAHDRLRLLRLSDDDFTKIPDNVFDAIMMRSALHHFVDFRGVAKLLASKLRANGALCMLEPRADFHIASSLILKGAKSKAALTSIKWSSAHESAVNDFVATAEFYLDRKRDKAHAEDKFVFYFEEFLEIANQTGTKLSCIGGEYESTFSSTFHDFLQFCMRVDKSIVNDIAVIVRDELAFMDNAYSSRPRSAAAEWFVFQRQGVSARS
jgi:ubiquinone/menaquinone biosynthesis C-methylase UbiE